MGSSDLRSFLSYLMAFPPLWARIGAAVVALGFNIGSPASIWDSKPNQIEDDALPSPVVSIAPGIARKVLSKRDIK
jgi:hypothetical protein